MAHIRNDITVIKHRTQQHAHANRLSRHVHVLAMLLESIKKYSVGPTVKFAWKSSLHGWSEAESEPKMVMHYLTIHVQHISK